MRADSDRAVERAMSTKSSETSASTGHTGEWRWTPDLPSTAVTRAEKIISGSIFGSTCAGRDVVGYADRHLKEALPIEQLISRRGSTASMTP